MNERNSELQTLKYAFSWMFELSCQEILKVIGTVGLFMCLAKHSSQLRRSLELTKYLANNQTLGTGSASFSAIIQNNCLNMSNDAFTGFVMLH